MYSISVENRHFFILQSHKTLKNRLARPLYMEIAQYNTTELRHLQLVLTDMMKEIDALCRRHGIRYFLNGGSAIGAIRHKGFIPWDDDIDIMMHDEDYERFIRICRKELPADRWVVQEGGVDWPMDYTKVRLRGTYYEDVGEYVKLPMDQRGFFIDIFRIINAAPTGTERSVQYFCERIRTAFDLKRKGYKAPNLKKRIIILLSLPLMIKPLRRMVDRKVYKYRNRETGYKYIIGSMMRRSKFFYKSEIFDGTEDCVFEDARLMIPAHCEDYLHQVFGDYMQMPPEDQRVSQHIGKLDFGVY